MCTQVRNPNENDWKKLTCEIKHIQYTRHLLLIMYVDRKSVGIWINTPHTVCADMRGHNGTYTGMGRKAIMSNVNQIKLLIPQVHWRLRLLLSERN